MQPCRLNTTSATELRSAGVSTAGIQADLDAAEPEAPNRTQVMKVQVLPEQVIPDAGTTTPRHLNINIIMILRELFYSTEFPLNQVNKRNTIPHPTQSVMGISDTRKTRLTLKQINKARKAGEFHKDEQQKELTFVRDMYGAANQPEV